MFPFPEQTADAEVVEEDPEEVEFESGEEPTESNETPTEFPQSTPRHRLEFSNVFMPYTPLEDFKNLAYVVVNPLHPSTHSCIRRAIQG